jgi:hypothetical protein
MLMLRREHASAARRNRPKPLRNCWSAMAQNSDYGKKKFVLRLCSAIAGPLVGIHMSHGHPINQARRGMPRICP